MKAVGAVKIFTRARQAATTAVGPIDLDISAGSFMAVVGPSGCGKSTLLRLIAGLDRPSAGVILRGGQPVTAPSREIGIVFQEHVLLPWLSVLDNVLLPAAIHSAPLAAALVRARGLLDRAGLSDFERHKLAQLSGGMKQRAAICRALLTDPQMLLLPRPRTAQTHRLPRFTELAGAIRQMIFDDWQEAA